MKQTNNDKADIIAPPPLIHLGFIVAGGAVHRMWPMKIIPDILQMPVGIGLIAFGMVLGFLAGRAFRKSGESPNPRSSTTALITTGPFRYTRNPLYLSAALIHTGVGIAADSLLIIAMLVPALILMVYGVILPEEEYLEKKFEDEYLNYKKSVRRWF